MYITYMYEYRSTEINFTMTDILLQNCSAACTCIIITYNFFYLLLLNLVHFKTALTHFFNMIMKI